MFLAHPGGPYFAKKDAGIWSIPKGVRDEGEDIFATALREFHEETGLTAEGNFIPLGELRQPSGKTVVVWAVEQDADPASVKSNPFTMEWPPASGQMREFPEVDRADWFALDDARVKILKGQAEFLDRLVTRLAVLP